ncbi:MAG: DUF2797 domain-containing protein [Pseudomonadota bacterium]|nr:DUF2797 domain-containing protein [Pseudomonadota bacterium]
MKISGNLDKMPVRHEDPVGYALPLGDEQVPLNELIGQTLVLEFGGVINCVNCGRETKKSFAQGHCFPCFRRLASCDMCYVSPERCHYEQGTCREPEWADDHCMRAHIVYLANTSGLKVGITRQPQIPVRWIDQGATQALPVFEVPTRYVSGRVEVLFKSLISDRTDWRRMLKGDPEPMDLPSRRDGLLDELGERIGALAAEPGVGTPVSLPDAEPVGIRYPVSEYPEKVKALNFDKDPRVAGTLLGIKGQYLILDTGVLNIRKFGGYRISMETPG